MKTNIFYDKKLIFGAVAVVGLMIIVFGPILGRLTERLAVNRQLKTEMTKLTEKSTALSGIDEILVSQRVEKMEEVFPSQKPVVALISSLSQISSRLNLSFGGV